MMSSVFSSNAKYLPTDCNSFLGGIRLPSMTGPLKPVGVLVARLGGIVDAGDEGRNKLDIKTTNKGKDAGV
jgi:hypothetical protein